MNCSSFRYARAERDLKQARPYGEGARRFYEQTEIESPKEEQKELFIAMTSDRGSYSLIEIYFNY